MANPAFHEFTRQASFFLRNKIKTARLVIFDVTPEELLTEEVTGDHHHLSPDKRTMSRISKAAFEVDQFERIVRILHRRLMKFERKSWRASYNALVLLEHLLIHGPLSTRKEFMCEEECIEEMKNFHYVDEKGFDWGIKVKDLCERVLKLLEEESYLKEERQRLRKQTVGRIIGIGNFSSKKSPGRETWALSVDFRRYNSLFAHIQDQKKHGLIEDLKNPLLINDERAQEDEIGGMIDADHPFFKDAKEAYTPLL